MTIELDVSTREQIAQAVDEWLLNDPQSNVFRIPREVAATAFNAPRWQAVCRKQKSWDGCANMKFSDLLTHLTHDTMSTDSGNGTGTLESLFNRLIDTDVRRALINVGETLDCASSEIKSHQLLDHKMIEERVAYWRERLLVAYGETPLAKLIREEPNRWGFYLYRPQGDKVVGDTYEVSEARRIEKLSLPFPKTAQAIVEFHAETSPDMKAVEGIDFDIHYIRASVVNDGVLIARLDSYLLSWPKALKHIRDGNFLSSCDSISQELGEFAYYMLVQHKSAKMIFAKGAVFYLHHWEVAQEWRGRYMGWDMIRQTMETIRRFEPTTGTVAVDLAPLQYYYPLPPMTPSEIRQCYLVDRAHLVDYWRRIFVHRVFGSQARTMHFEAAKPLTRDELTQAIASLNGQREHLSS